MRILGLDLGERRIGVALSDTMEITAQPLTVLTSQDVESDARAVARLIEDNEAGRVVVGMPVGMSGEPGGQADKTLRFVETLKGVTGIPVETWDERLTTVSADRILREADVPPKKRRELRDKIAAAVILQAYLDAQRNKNG